MKSIILEAVGGQQFMGATPCGRSAGPHFVTSGAAIGAAKEISGCEVVVSKVEPPTASKRFLRSSLTDRGCFFGS